MSQEKYILFADDMLWQLGIDTAEQTRIVSIHSDDDVTTSLTNRIATALSQAGYRQGNGIVLALPSNWCLAAEISTADLPRSARSDALAYRLEEKLPLPAESIVADFVRQENHIALGVCAPLERIKPLVEEIEILGVSIQHICPIALLAVQEAKIERTLFPPCLCILDDGEAWDIVQLTADKPRIWRHPAGNLEALTRELTLLIQPSDQPPRLNHVDMVESKRAAISASVRAEHAIVAESKFVLAARAGAQVLHGIAVPWIDLRQGVLGSRDRLYRIQQPLTFVISAITCLFLCVAVSLLWRAHRYEAYADAETSHQIQLFHQALPQQQVPVDVISRLASEERRLRGISGDSMNLPTAPSALSLFNSVLANLPKSLRYRILELRLDGTTLYVEGEARSHGDAESIASAVRGSGVFSIDPPKSEQRPDKEVSFTLTGSVVAASPGSQVAMGRAQP